VVFSASGQDHWAGRGNVAVKECKPRKRLLKILPDTKISQHVPELQSTQDCSETVTLLERVDGYWLMLHLQHKSISQNTIIRMVQPFSSTEIERKMKTARAECSVMV